MKNKLSFGEDEGDEEEEDEAVAAVPLLLPLLKKAAGAAPAGEQQPAPAAPAAAAVGKSPAHSTAAAAANGNGNGDSSGIKDSGAKRPRFATLGKDPSVRTDFLPDKDREREEGELTATALLVVAGSWCAFAAILPCFAALYTRRMPHPMCCLRASGLGILRTLSPPHAVSNHMRR